MVNENKCEMKRTNSFNVDQHHIWKLDRSKSCVNSPLFARNKCFLNKSTSFPKDLQLHINTKHNINSSDPNVNTPIKENNFEHDNKENSISTQELSCRPISYPFSQAGQECYKKHTKCSSATILTPPSTSFPDLVKTKQICGSSTDTRVEGHKIKNRIVLTEDLYEQFRDNLVKNKIPKYLHMTYLDTDSNTIFIGVEERHVEEAKEIIAKLSPQLFYDDLFDIQPMGEIDYCGSKTRDFAVKPVITAENNTYQSTPGQILPKIQTGKTIETRVCSENAAEAVSVRLATFGSIIKDVNSGKLYGITAKHAYNKKDGFEIGDGDTYCDIQFNENINGEYPTLSKCQVSKNFIGIHGGFLNEKTGYRCALDIAVVPLLDHLKIGIEIFPYFENKSGLVDITIYRGATGNMKGKKVQQLGGKSSLVPGEIIVPKFDVYIQGNWLGNDAFLVASEDTVFASQGDSGALILDDLSSNCSDANAYGILFFVERKCFRKSPNTGKPYPAIAWCTRLDYGLDYIQQEQQEHNIVFDFVKPHHMVTPGTPSMQTTDSPIAKYGTIPWNLGNCSRIKNSYPNSVTLGSMNVSTSSIFVEEQCTNTFQNQRSESDPCSLHYKVNNISQLHFTSTSEEILDISKQRTTSDSVFSKLGVRNHTHDVLVKKDPKNKIARLKNWLKKLKPSKKKTTSTG